MEGAGLFAEGFAGFVVREALAELGGHCPLPGCLGEFQRLTGHADRVRLVPVRVR